jgi:hypothetical protein
LEISLGRPIEGKAYRATLAKEKGHDIERQSNDQENLPADKCGETAAVAAAAWQAAERPAGKS